MHCNIISKQSRTLPQPMVDRDWWGFPPEDEIVGVFQFRRIALAGVVGAAAVAALFAVGSSEAFASSGCSAINPVGERTMLVAELAAVGLQSGAGSRSFEDLDLIPRGVTALSLSLWWQICNVSIGFYR
jgi:hypothetical protein